MSAIEIARQDLSISQLRAEAARTADAKQARRILAIAMVLDGHSRLLAAQASARDRQTLRDWVHRYNADGLAGLADRPRPGRQPRLAEAQRSEVAKWVEDGPDLKTDGVVRWRCADLRDRIAAKFNVHLHERSVGKLLKKLNFSSMSVRPVHPQSDLEVPHPAGAVRNRPRPSSSDNCKAAAMRLLRPASCDQRSSTPAD